MRSFYLTNKKVRGIPRRLRALKEWSASFAGYFPTGLSEAHQYCNFKLPIHESLVEGPQATDEIKRVVIQCLIEAGQHLIEAKPASAKNVKVLITLCLPDMFSSEVCIYTDYDYYLSKIIPLSNEFGSRSIISERRLSEQWQLQLADNIGQLGFALDYRGFDDPDDWYQGEIWYFGDIDPQPQS